VHLRRFLPQGHHLQRFEFPCPMDTPYRISKQSGERFTRRRFFKIPKISAILAFCWANPLSSFLPNLVGIGSKGKFTDGQTDGLRTRGDHYSSLELKLFCFTQYTRQTYNIHVNTLAILLCFLRTEVITIKYLETTFHF